MTDYKNRRVVEDEPSLVVKIIDGIIYTAVIALTFAILLIL